MIKDLNFEKTLYPRVVIILWSSDIAGTSPRTGTLKSVIISSNAAAQNDIENFQQIIEDGGELHEAQNDRARVISFTSRAQTYENVLRNLDEFSKSVTITVE